MIDLGYAKSRYAIAVARPASAAEKSGEAGGAILYNAMTGTLALVGSDVRETLEAFGDPLGTLPSDETRATAEKLAELGFLVDPAHDELRAVRARHEAAQQDDSTLALCIAPTYACNLRCPYCYEKGHASPASIMDEATQDKVVRLAQDVFAARPYARMEVQWYGGEPLLAPDVIARLSRKLIGFCQKRGIEYAAEAITNATLIGAREAAMLAEAKVASAVVTVDGPHDAHNARRPAADGTDSYEAVMGGIGHLKECGIAPAVLMNTDKVNGPLFDELAAEVQARFGIRPKQAKLNDYQRTFGAGSFRAPAFDLYDHAEFARAECERFCSEGHAPEEFRALLAPVPLFCRGQMENYFVIDAAGDVYKCDGYAGCTGHAIFNLDDAVDLRARGTAPAYPFDDERCTRCAILPICKGTCRWERESCADDPCHPLKYAIDGYLRGWVEALGLAEPEPGEVIVVR